MKYLLSLLFLGSMAACIEKPTDHFVLRGTVPGAIDSTEVTLASYKEYHKKIASGYVINGRFELQGKVNAPVYCRLSMNDQHANTNKESKDKSPNKYVEIGFFC